MSVSDHNELYSFLGMSAEVYDSEASAPAAAINNGGGSVFRSRSGDVVQAVRMEGKRWRNWKTGKKRWE